jgi:hypothetical protein
MRTVTVRAGCVAAALAAVLLATARMRADSIELANGDVLNGRVVGLDEKELRLESAIHGKLSIPRAKIVAITFGDRKPVAAAPAVGTAKMAAPGKELTADDVLKQLAAAGNGGNAGDLQKLLPLLATPEASKYFNSTLKGLQTGSMNVQDIRRDAIRARDEFKKATKGLGPDVEAAMAPYMGLLERFIQETEPPAKKAAPPQKK